MKSLINVTPMRVLKYWLSETIDRDSLQDNAVEVLGLSEGLKCIDNIPKLLDDIILVVSITDKHRNILNDYGDSGNMYKMVLIVKAYLKENATIPKTVDDLYSWANQGI